MTEITGIVNTTHIIQNNTHQVVIDINTTNGDNERVFHIMYGTIKFHSICWIIKYSINIPINASIQDHREIDNAKKNEIKVQR